MSCQREQRLKHRLLLRVGPDRTEPDLSVFVLSSFNFIQSELVFVL